MLRSYSALITAALACSLSLQGAAQTTIIEDVTLIDGSGGKPQKNMYVTVIGDEIRLVEDEAPGGMPRNASRIDGKGKYLLPGFIDTNVHASVYGNSRRRETAVKYGPRNRELAEEFAQRQLKYGVTTIRDSYGSLLPLMQVRDAINRGEVIGPRMLVAGNIVGWGGPFSLTFSLMRESDLTLFQEEWNDIIAQGAGEELMDMTPEQLRVAINAYLDKGPDFIKYGGTSHFRYPSLIGFSPRAQAVIVEETHKRNKVVETHATSVEALRMAVEAGIDFIQHPEILSAPYPAELILLIIENDVICGLRSNTLSGEPLRQHKASRKAALEELENAPAAATSAEQRRRLEKIGHGYEIELANARALIKAGCHIAIATDNYQGRAPEFRRAVKPAYQEAGTGSLLAIEGLVELGMTPMQALVAGTRNGAIAARGIEKFGTIEVGKSADLVMLSADPLRDIGNIRRQHMVMARGKIINTSALPLKKIFYTVP